MAGNKVSVKYGTWQKYKNLSSVDPDTLYFITDKGGTIYKGSESVYAKNVIETFSGESETIGTDTQWFYNFELECFNANSQGSVLTPNNPVKYTFSVYSKEAVIAIKNVLQAALQDHTTWTQGGNTVTAGKSGTNERFGHVKITDDVDMTGTVLPEATSGGTAVTPKGVYDAINTALGSMSGAMVFKGTIGAAADNPTVTHLPYSGYLSGWTYKVVTEGTYAGLECFIGDLIIAINDGPASGSAVIDADWTVSQSDTEGMVTADNNLTNNTVVLGNGNKTVKILSNGSQGTFLRVGASGSPVWDNHAIGEHGIGYCICSTPSSGYMKEATCAQTLSIQNGSMVSVKFNNEIVWVQDHSIQLSINNGTAYKIMYRGYEIEDNVVRDGDTALMMFYDGNYHIISVDSQFSDVAFSANYDDILNQAIVQLQDTSSSSTAARVLSCNGYTLGSTRIVCVEFVYGITASNVTLSINGTTALNIKYHGQNLTGDVVKANDKVTMICNGNSYNIIAIDKPIESTVSSGSSNLVTSSAVYNAISNSTLYWEALT